MVEGGLMLGERVKEELGSEAHNLNRDFIDLMSEPNERKEMKVWLAIALVLSPVGHSSL